MNKASSSGAENAVARARGPRGFGGPVVKAKDKKGTMLRIWRYMKKEKWSLVVSIVFVILSTLLSLCAPYLIGIIVDEYIIPKDMSGTVRMLILLAGIYTASAVFTWLQTFLMVNVSLKTIRVMRQDLFNKFQTLSLRFFDKRTDGELMSRVTNDIDNLNQALSQSVSQIVSTILMASGVIIAMFSLNWVLAVVTLLVIPLMILILVNL